MDKNVSLVYMVAWMSSRFGWKIKQFAKVWPNNSTLIEYSMNQAINSWINKIVFIVWKMTKGPFQEMFGNKYKWIPIFYAEQTFDEETRDKPRWTVDALCSATQFINWPFIVCNWDDIYGENSFKILVDHLTKSDELVSLWYILKNVIPEEGSTNRWIFQVDENYYVEAIEENIGIEKSKLAEKWLKENDLASMNIFGLNTLTLKLLNEKLAKFKENNKWDRKIECYLPVEISNIMKENWIKMKLYSTPDKWFWVTNPEDEETVRQQIEEIESNK